MKVKISLFLALLSVAAFTSCSSTNTVENPYGGRLGANGTSNNMGAGPSNAYGNMAGMTGSPNWVHSSSNNTVMGAQ